MSTNPIVRLATPTDTIEIEAVVFDLDGTLYRQGPLRRRMLRELLLLPLRIGSFRTARSTIRQIRSYRRALEMLRTAPPVDGVRDLGRWQCEIAALAAGVEPQVVEATATEWLGRRPLPYLLANRRAGVESLLDALRHAGLPLGVFSDYPVEAKLSALELADYFDATGCASDRDIQALKPDPAGVLHIANRLGRDPRRTLYVGDRIDVDAGAATRAGMPCAIIGRQAGRTAPPCLGVKTFAELQSRFEGLARPS